MGHPTGHKRGGTKLKNHKLRPAPAPAAEAPAAAVNKAGDGASGKAKGKGKGKGKAVVEHAADDSGYGDGDEASEEAFRKELRKDDRPLRGCVITLSGLPDLQKTEQKRCAEALGATVEKALTTNVTHVVCLKAGESAKYTVALQHRKTIMQTTWLETLYSAFADGSDVDVDEATALHRMPALYGLGICSVGAFGDDDSLDLVSQNGGRSHARIGPATTHVLVFSDTPEGTLPASSLVDEVVAKAAVSGKTLKPGNTQPGGIEAVWAEWLEDSLEAGGALPTELYRVERGRPRPGRQTAISAPERVAPAVVAAPADELVKAGQRDKLEAAVVRKAAKAASGGAALDDDLSFASAADRAAQLQAVPKASSTKLADLMDRTKKPAAASVVKRLSSVRSDKFADPAPAAPAAMRDPTGEYTPSLAGAKISVCGVVDKKGAVPAAIVNFGGTLVDSHEEADYTVLRIANPPVIPNGCNPVNINWLERSCREGKLLDPDSTWGYRPLRTCRPRPDLKQHRVAHAGFSAPEEKALDRLLKELGFVHDERPRRSTLTHMIAGPEESTRLETVRKWARAGERVRIVGVEWVEEASGCKRITRGADEDIVVVKHRESSLPVAEDTGGPLAGCVLCLSKTVLGQARTSAADTCRRLGAELVPKFTGAVTHLLHVVDKAGAGAKDLKHAREAKAAVVHPQWLAECDRTGSRVDEHFFPHTYLPGSALSYTVITEKPASQTSMRRTVSKASPEPHRQASKLPDGFEDDESTIMPPPLDLPKLPTVARGGPMKARSPVRAQVKSLPSSPFQYEAQLPPEESGNSPFTSDGPPAAQQQPHGGMLRPSSPESSRAGATEPSSETADRHQPGPQTQMHALLSHLQPGTNAVTGDTAGAMRRGPKAARPTHRALAEGGVAVSGTRSLSDLSPPHARPPRAPSAGAGLRGFGLGDGWPDDEADDSLKIGWADPDKEAERERILKALGAGGGGGGGGVGGVGGGGGGVVGTASARKRSSEVDMLATGPGGAESPPQTFKRSRPRISR